ncbi:ABC transporter substrate-binding protein [Algihabitans albus]|uniref:ABC transporter substrate-binding protein n=1 Tax=Algihabitans albus TaxID=2164067 RepID=UPI000E5CFE06|nr:extracellular solute-binding protein [Algihabitans albus]
MQRSTSVSAPFIQTSGRTTLRILGTSVTLIEPIRAQAQADLGIDLDFTVLDGVNAQLSAVTKPNAFDVYDQWFHNMEIAWTSGAIQPVEIERIAQWDLVNDLSKHGSLRPGDPIGQGDAPVRQLYVRPDSRLSWQQSDRIVALPCVHNVDAFGYNTDAIDKGMAYATESWSWLLDARYAGRVGLLADPAIGVIDAALAAQAAGLMEFGDLGNLSITEIDALVRLLIAKKKAGHFGAFWSSVDEAVAQMRSGKVVIESLWSPGVVALKAAGVPVRTAAPKEGYRAWHGCLALSARISGRARDAAYEYLNWWLSGWPGAVMARQGYYISVPEPVKRHLTAAEWEYWFLGKPAREDLANPYGQTVVRAGEARNGGSYWDRVSHIRVWNSTMDEHNYLVRRWQDFLRA